MNFRDGVENMDNNRNRDIFIDTFIFMCTAISKFDNLITISGSCEG
jgi:hypothetical protein